MRLSITSFNISQSAYVKHMIFAFRDIWRKLASRSHARVSRVNISFAEKAEPPAMSASLIRHFRLLIAGLYFSCRAFDASVDDFRITSLLWARAAASCRYLMFSSQPMRYFEAVVSWCLMMMRSRPPWKPPGERRFEIDEGSGYSPRERFTPNGLLPISAEDFRSVRVICRRRARECLDGAIGARTCRKLLGLDFLIMAQHHGLSPPPPRYRKLFHGRYMQALAFLSDGAQKPIILYFYDSRCLPCRQVVYDTPDDFFLFSHLR